MNFKRFFSFLIVFIIFVSLFSFTSLAEEYDAKIEIDYKVLESDNILIKATLNNIKAVNGVILCEYDFIYDPNALKLVNATVNIPDNWKSNLGDSDDSTVENWSMLMQDGLYYWSIFSITPNSGVRNNDQLYIVLEFEKLKNSKTTIQLANGVVVTEYETTVNGNVSYNPYQLNTNNATIEIDLNTPDKPNIDTDVSNEISNPILRPPVESGDSSVSGEAGSVSKEPIKLPHVGTVSGEDAPDKPADDDKDIINEDDSNNANLIWIILAIIAVVIVFVVVYIIVSKRPKGSKND